MSISYEELLEKLKEAHKNDTLRIQQLDTARAQLRDRLVGTEAQIQLILQLQQAQDTTSSNT